MHNKSNAIFCVSPSYLHPHSLSFRPGQTFPGEEYQTVYFPLMSRSVTDPRLTFHASYHDPHSEIDHHFLVLYFTDGTVELIDSKSQKTILKRTGGCQNLSIDQLFLGSSIVVFGKILKLYAYGDVVTEQLCEKTGEATCAVFSEDAFPALGKHLDVLIQECSYSVAGMQTVVVPLSGAVGAKGSLQLPAVFRGRRAVVMRLIRDNAIQRSQELPARLAGQSGVMWVARDKSEVEEASYLFSLANAATAGAGSAASSSVVVVKPHVLRSRRGGEALHLLLQNCSEFGGRLQAISQLALSSAQADQFTQPYKGIIGEMYRGTVEQLSAGTLWAIQLVGQNTTSDAATFVENVRTVAGPFAPSIAKVLRPASLRARFGLDVAHNGLYCTDLPEDAADDVAALFYGQFVQQA